MEKNINTNTIKQKGMLRRWWFWLGMLLVLVLISLAGIWKYFSSAIYFQRNVRPELENLLGGRPVTVGTYALTPLSAIHLKDVEVGALPDETNKTPVLTIKEMDVRYNALAMRNNRIVVSKALIESLTARIEQLPDGSFRGPFPTLVPKTDEEKDTTTTLHTKSPKKIKVKTKSKGQQYDIQNVEVRNVNIQFNQSGKAGNAPQKFALENFSLICPRFSLTEPFQIELKGKVRANNLSADIAFSPKATLKEGRIYLASASLQVEENGKPLLRVDVGLDVDPTTQSGNATLKILPTDKRFLNLAATMSGIDFHEAALAGDLQIALDKGEPSALKGMLTTTKWNPTGPNIPANLPETDWQFAFDALLGNDQSMQITSSTLLATATGHPDRALLNLNASGPVRWGKKGGAQLQLKAPCVELQPYLPALKIQPGEKAPALTITNLSTQFSCDSDQVQLKNLTAEVTGGKIAVKNFQTSLTPNPLLHWNGLEAQNVDLDTLLANVSAKHWGQLTGKGYLLSSGTACGLSEESMREALRGSLTASITNGELKNVPVLDELANSTKIPDLHTMPFNQFDSEFIAGDENIRIKRCYLIGPEQKAEASGSCEYDTSLKAPLNLALGGKLKEFAQREKLAKAFKADADGYLVFPLPMLITGKLAKPKIKLDVPKEELVQTANDILQQLDKKSSKDKTSDKTEKPNLQNVLDVLKKKKTKQ